MDKKEYEKLTRLYKSAPELKAIGLSPGYKKLLEYNDTVLAIKRFNNRGIENEFEFVTWRKGTNGGMCWGHYTTDFDSAKEDFVKRSELIESARIFNNDELSVIYKGLVEGMLASDLDLDTRGQMEILAERIFEFNYENIDLNEAEDISDECMEGEEEIEI